jgi:predicted dehydrogenase
MAKAIVVGAGGISGAWFNPLKKENIDIVAVVDLNKDAAQKRIEQHELPNAIATDDLDKALAEYDCDFVCDITIPDAHCEVTCKALEAGRHVIGEKPMAGNFEQAKKMVATAEKTGKLYMVSQSRRWHLGVLDIENAITQKTVGDLTAMTCEFFLRCVFEGFRAAMDHVLLVDMAIHHFDLARKMAQVDPVSVYAEDYNTPDSWARHGVAASALFRMSDDVRFTYSGSWCPHGYQNSWDGDWRLQCTEGSLHYKQMQRGEALRGDIDGTAKETTSIDIQVSEPPAGGQHAALRELLKYMADGTMPQSECHDNIKSFAMVCAAVESCETGKPVDIQAMLS